MPDSVWPHSLAAHQALLSLGFSRQENWSGLPFPSPMHENEKWKWSHSVVSDSQWPHGLQPTRLLSPWDFPVKSTRAMPENIDVITISDSNYFNYSDVCKVDQVTHKMIMVWREMESPWFPTLSQENELLADTTIFTNPANNHGSKDCGPDLNVRPIMMIISSTHLTELKNEFYLNFQSDFCVSVIPLQCILRNLCLDMQVTNMLNQSVVWRK